jgi:hypothetical protein
LVNAPEETIEKIKWRLLGKLSVATDESPEFVEKWAIVERSMKFSHINPYQRVFKKPVERMTSFQQQFLYDRVKICREWLFNFDEMYKKLNN